METRLQTRRRLATEAEARASHADYDNNSQVADLTNDSPEGEVMSTAMPTTSPPQPNDIGVQSPNQLNQSTRADSDGQPSPTTTSAVVPGRVQVIPISQLPRARDSTQSLYFDAPTAQSPPMLSAISAAIQVTAADEFIIPIPTAGGTGMQLPNSPNPLPSYQTAL